MRIVKNLELYIEESTDFDDFTFDSIDGAFYLALVVQQMCTFEELDATFKNYAYVQSMDQEQILHFDKEVAEKV